MRALCHTLRFCICFPTDDEVRESFEVGSLSWLPCKWHGSRRGFWQRMDVHTRFGLLFSGWDSASRGSFAHSMPALGPNTQVPGPLVGWGRSHEELLVSQQGAHRRNTH